MKTTLICQLKNFKNIIIHCNVNYHMSYLYSCLNIEIPRKKGMRYDLVLENIE